MKYSLLIVSVLLIAQASAAIIIRANTPGSNGMGATNTNIASTFGDNISLASPGNAVFETSLGVIGTVGTPNIDLTWSRSGTSSGQNAWQYQTWSAMGDSPSKTDGGTLQKDGSAVGLTYSITFAPAVGDGVVICAAVAHE